MELAGVVIGILTVVLLWQQKRMLHRGNELPFMARRLWKCIPQ
jgi:hypothetical protein